MCWLLAFKLGAAGLPFTDGSRSAVSSADRHCTVCLGQNFGDRLHVVFKCAAMQPLRVKYAQRFAAGITDMRTFFMQPNNGPPLGYVLYCLQLFL